MITHKGFRVFGVLGFWVFGFSGFRVLGFQDPRCMRPIIM
jgi:hypothetical protein